MESVLPLGFRDVSHTTVEKILYIADFILEEEAGWLLNRGGFKLAMIQTHWVRKTMSSILSLFSVPK